MKLRLFSLMKSGQNYLKNRLEICAIILFPLLYFYVMAAVGWYSLSVTEVWMTIGEMRRE